MASRAPISIRRADSDDAGPYPYCPTCQHQFGEGPCGSCEDGDAFEIHPMIEEEFF